MHEADDQVQGRLIPRHPVRLPRRVPFDAGDDRLLETVLHEYDAIRSEIDHSLSNQVSVLSFGAATVGLLAAAAGTLWDTEVLLPGVLLLFVVPAACFLALAIHAGELIRLMRAGLFLYCLEVWINRRLSGTPERCVLAWEHWGIRKHGPDVDRNNRWAITGVFTLLALGFIVAGFWHLYEPPGDLEFDDTLAFIMLGVSLFVSALALLWVTLLYRFAYKHRDYDERRCTASEAAASPRSPDDDDRSDLGESAPP